jgi:hypothetical protein
VIVVVSSDVLSDARDHPLLHDAADAGAPDKHTHTPPQTSHEFARVLSALGFSCTSMGGETRMDVATYEPTGGAPQQ